MLTINSAVPVVTKISAPEKQRFFEATKSIGTTPSNAIRMFISAFNKRGAFPFDVSQPVQYDYETIKTMRDVAHGNHVSQQFATVDEMFADLDA